MYKKINSYFLIFIILFSMFPVKADAPINYNKELTSDVKLRGAFFTNDNSDDFYVSFDNGIIQIDSNNHYIDKTIKIKGTALTNRLKGYNGFNIGLTHISDKGIITNEIKPLKIDKQGFAYLNTNFSTVIINGMTGITTTTLTGLSGNQSISVPNGSSYDLNITNNQKGIWASTDGKNYTNKSLITINGSMVTTAIKIPLQLFINLEGVNGTGDIGIAYTNLTAIPREIEAIWDSDNVSLFSPYDTISGVDSEFVVLWGADNITEPAADSTYGSRNVWNDTHKIIHHFNTDPTGTINNSAGVNHNLTNAAGSMTSGDLIDSPTSYGKAVSMDSDDKLASSTAVAGVVDEWTVLTIHKPTTTGISHPFIFIEGDQLPAQYLPNLISIIAGRSNLLYSTRVCGPSAYIKLYDTTAGEETGNILFTMATWSGTTLKIYKNNVEITSFTKHVDTTGSQTDAARKIRFEFNQEMIEVRLINEVVSSGFRTTVYNNFLNPTAAGTASFYKSIGTTETAPGTTNITASVNGDSNEQSYNTSQSREFTLTPTGSTNNISINTTSIDYNVTVTTYWTENTILQSETAIVGYAKQYINYTPSFNITSADMNTTFSFDFSAQDYIGTASSTLNDVSKTTTRDGKNINASVGNLIKNNSYWWNVTVPYNNIFTLSNQSDIIAYLGVSKQFTDSIYNDPDNNSIFSRLWNFGDSTNINTSNPSHIYTSLGVFNANYTVTEDATTNNQTITKEFNVIVEVQPPQNVTTISHQTNVSINWNNYTYADKYSVYELEDGFPYVDTDPIIDGIKDTVYNYAHEFLILSPNPVNHGDYETIYPLRTTLGAYLLIESIDNDDKSGDDDTIYYFDLDNDGLTANDPAWKITNNIIKKYLWDGVDSWDITGSTNAVGDSTGGGTHYPIHELFIPVAELGVNWTNGSTVKVLVKREDSALSPDVITWYPYGNINNTNTDLWQEMVLNDPESYNLLSNVTSSNYTAINLTPFTIYHGAVSSRNGSTESDYTLFDVITEDIPVYNVSGYIMDDLGNKLSGAIVYSCNGFVHEITQSDIYGYWIGYNFREGNYTICGNKSGYIDNSTNIYVSSNMTNINVTLTAYTITDWEIYQKLLLLESQNDEILLNISINNTIVNDKIDTILIFILLNMTVIVGIIIGKRGKDNDK